MHISCEKNKLKNAIDQVSKAITSKQLLPILGHILFETTEDNKLKLTASSLDIGITCQIETDEVREPGTTTCSAKVISEIVNSMPSGLINLDIDSNINSELVISNNFSVFKVMTLPSEEFPKSVKPQECESINISAEDFCKAVNKSTISIADASESRPIMQGLSIKFVGDEVHFVSTDGKRLSKAVIETSEKREKDQIIVPGKPLNDLLKIINKDENIQIQYSKTHLFVSSENTSFFCKLIEGNYPDYEKVIPKSFQGTCRISREIITSAISRMMIMAKDRDIPNVVKFHFTDDKLNLSAETSGIGSGNENIDVIHQGEELKIAFNGKFILDALKVLDEDEIVLRLQDNKNSMAIQNDEDDKSFIYICMPIRTK